MFFKNRQDAGRVLAGIIKQHSYINNQWDIVGIARGGVIIANEIAMSQDLRPKSICIEDAIGKNGDIVVASSLGSGMVFTESQEKFIPDISKVDQRLYQKTIDKQLSLVKSTTYSPKLLICDDGVVSGMTLITAIQCLQYHGAREIAIAIPVILPWLAHYYNFKIFTYRITKMSNPSTGVFYKSFSDVNSSEIQPLLQ